eukprot:NODE_4975_length_995_cov_100.889908_g4768_i0.p1 GENE.NODE_4975_length_995_cov_100.889908_g4768_i0~~NODE_4975_length_995_cov_100.889908_g4768_i0.p1  ORF type:complete len:261 (+),score=41.12 NODE_4975_length_995_cov_100.889908_g4768_i0:115-897(+)
MVSGPPSSATVTGELPQLNVMDLGCTDISLVCMLGNLCGKAATGIVQVDEEDLYDTQLSNDMKLELSRFGLLHGALPVEGSFPEHTNTFDLVVCADLLSYCPRDHARILEWVLRSLKPGGTMTSTLKLLGEIAADGNLEILRMACYAALNRRGFPAANHDPYFFPTKEEFNRVLVAAGFKVEHLAALSFPTALPVMVEGLEEDALSAYLRQSVARNFVEGFDIEDEVIAACAASGFKGPLWEYDAHRLQFVATKPQEGVT